MTTDQDPLMHEVQGARYFYELGGDGRPIVTDVELIQYGDKRYNALRYGLGVIAINPENLETTHYVVGPPIDFRLTSQTQFTIVEEDRPPLPE